MLKNNINEIKLKTLVDFFNKTKLPKKPFRLNQAEVINNCEKFVESHLAVLKANRGNKAMLPYFLRLKNFYLKIKK